MTEASDNTARNESPHQSRVYAVLGGTGGIGRVLVQRLTQQGATVCVAAKDQEKLESLAEDTGISWSQVDGTDPEQVSTWLNRVADDHARIDGIANLVGSIMLKPAHLLTFEQWQQTIALNLHSAYAVLHAGSKLMQNHGGSIVLMSSVASKFGLPNHEAIAAAKAGVNGLTIAAAATYAAKRIRVNAVAPGLVRTPMSESILSSEAAEKMSKSMHPLGELGEPGDIAPMVAWLLGTESKWVTGQVFSLDGGMSSVRSKG